MSITTVTSPQELKETLENIGTTPVDIAVTNSMDLTASDIKQFTIPSGDVTISLNEGVEIKGVSGIFLQTGGTLTLKGPGKITTTTTQTKAAVYTENAGTVLNIDGVVIDTQVYNPGQSNYCYGVYAKNGAEVNVKSGLINVGGSSCISTNNTTGGATFNITGGKLHSTGSYAIYFPTQGLISITGGEVQGISMRMGTLVVSGDAKIIPTTIDASNCDPIGSNITTSGCIWTGETISVLSGTYSDPKGTDTNITIKGDATVTGNEFKPAIGIYLLDTKQADNVEIAVANPENIINAHEGTQTIKVYGHADIAAAAAEAGKPYTPMAEEKEVIIEEVPEEEEYTANDLKEMADEYNSEQKPKEEQVAATVNAIANRAKATAKKGGYEVQILYDSYTIPWNLEYKEDVITGLRSRGFQIKKLYASNDLQSDYGINVKWN
jgi:hypothetical protein